MKKIKKIKELCDMGLDLSSILVPETYKTVEPNAGYYSFSCASRPARWNS